MSTSSTGALRIFANGNIPVSQLAQTQARKAAALPGVVHGLGMPDIHATAKGLPNGFVLATDGVVYPAAVGTDINCGMQVLRIHGLYREAIDFDALLPVIATRVNLGKRWSHITISEADLDQILAGGIGALAALSPETVQSHPVWEHLTPQLLSWVQDHTEYRGSLPGDPAAVAHSHKREGTRQLGTIGSGNHFLEFETVDRVCDPVLAAAFGLERSAITVMIHSGSRGMGHQIGEQFIQRATALGKRTPTSIPGICPLDLADVEGRRYLAAMYAGANYAFVNRLLIGTLVAMVIAETFPETRTELIYDVAHNLAAIETHHGRELVVHRKGATRAFPASRMQGTPFAAVGQPVLIPGSMGTPSYILAGVEGSQAALHSTNHGAGRVLSRKEALGYREGDLAEPARYGGRVKRTPYISDEEFRRSMRGVALHYHDGRTIRGEAPAAFKDIAAVIDVVEAEGLAMPVARLKPIGVIKE